MKTLKKTGFKTPYRIRKANQVLRHPRKHSKAQRDRARATIRSWNKSQTRTKGGKKKKKGVKVAVVHRGVLEVPKGKSVSQLSTKHFVKLARRKGHAAISRALTNLQRWNKNKNKKLSNWAKNMKSRIRTQLGKAAKKKKRKKRKNPCGSSHRKRPRKRKKCRRRKGRKNPCGSGHRKRPKKRKKTRKRRRNRRR